MKPLLIVMLLGQGADVATSLMGFHRGATELNPFIVSTQPAPFIAQAVGFGIAETLILKKIHKNHPKLANTLGMIQIGGSTAASINNIQVYREMGRRLNR